VTADTSFKLPGALDAAVRAEVEAWSADDKMKAGLALLRRAVEARR
jgi:hypothetical protein